ncbi:hypothetical protein F5882DRAFT_471088 [Hyaloscypha sp. PMI_1271]|nr:hypothetical protein F5882DRAFT_471088 [Hyaloscypha sp. PMI_1271]
MSDVEAFRCFQSFSYSGKAYAMKSEVPDFPVLLRTWDLAKRLQMDYFQTHLLDCMDARRSEIGCTPDVQVIKEVFEDNEEGCPLRFKFMDWIEKDIRAEEEQAPKSKAMNSDLKFCSDLVSP